MLGETRMVRIRPCLRRSSGDITMPSAAERRIELLRMRFSEDLPVREIARRWGEEAERLHYHLKRAREEFKEALREIVRLHDPVGSVEEECARLLEHLS